MGYNFWSPGLKGYPVLDLTVISKWERKNLESHTASKPQFSHLTFFLILFILYNKGSNSKANIKGGEKSPIVAAATKSQKEAKT